MKKLFLAVTLFLVGCAQPDSTLTQCQQYCRDNLGEKCYDISSDDFSAVDTDGEAGCGNRINECLNNCQKDSANTNNP